MDSGIITIIVSDPRIVCADDHRPGNCQLDPEEERQGRRAERTPEGNRREDRQDHEIAG